MAYGHEVKVVRIPMLQLASSFVHTEDLVSTSLVQLQFWDVSG